MTSRGHFTRTCSFFLLTSLIAMLILSGCSSTPSTSAIPTPTSSVTPIGTQLTGAPAAAKNTNNNIYSIAIIFNGEQQAAYTVADLLQLDQVEIKANGSPQNGPTLLSTLKAAGISDFTEVTAYGLSRGRLATAQYTFKRDQIDGTVIFDMNKKGKCKLCGTNIPQSNWIIDVERIEVK